MHSTLVDCWLAWLQAWLLVDRSSIKKPDYWLGFPGGCINRNSCLQCRNYEVSIIATKNIYIYICRERERERERAIPKHIPSRSRTFTIVVFKIFKLVSSCMWTVSLSNLMSFLTGWFSICFSHRYQILCHSLLYMLHYWSINFKVDFTIPNWLIVHSW